MHLCFSTVSSSIRFLAHFFIDYTHSHTHIDLILCRAIFSTCQHQFIAATISFLVSRLGNTWNTYTNAAAVWRICRVNDALLCECVGLVVDQLIHYRAQNSKRHVRIIKIQKLMKQILHIPIQPFVFGSVSLLCSNQLTLDGLDLVLHKEKKLPKNVNAIFHFII